jgi:4-diphosphocytidyl-2-C-methyl-D-erythritol kinase
MAAVTIRAFAKINLSLRVKGARPDGFHDVQTILQTIDLSDRLVCEARRVPFEIICARPIAEVPTDRTNLIWKAAQRLWNAAGRDGQPLGVVRLDKKIPVKAGLGGGSSDAAASLLALRRVWKLRVADEELHAIAAGLGSDVPYFLVGGTALGLGRGEEVYPLADLPRWWVVVIVPPFGIATAEAYAWLDQARAGGSNASEARHLPGTWLGQVIPLVNDLETSVIERHPVIGKLRDKLTALGATLSAMSGSGSAVFGVFTTRRAAAAAARTLARSDARTLVVRMRPRRALNLEP